MNGAGMAARWRTWAPQLLSILRIVAAFLFFQFGSAKWFAYPAAIMPGGATVATGSLFWFAAVLEVFGGALLFLGLFTRPVAFVLRYARGHWAELPHGRVRIRELGPTAGATYRARVVQVAAEFSAPSRIVQAGLWVDGKAVPGQPHGTPTRFTAYGATPRLARGMHTAAAFAEAGSAARAVVWSFRVR